MTTTSFRVLGFWLNVNSYYTCVDCMEKGRKVKGGCRKLRSLAEMNSFSHLIGVLNDTYRLKFLLFRNGFFQELLIPSTIF